MVKNIGLFRLLLPFVALAGCTRSAPVTASIACADGGFSGPVTQTVLVWGESWAARGRLLPHLPRTLAARVPGRVRVCQVGYSGLNTHLQLERLRRDWSADKLERVLGSAPTAVLVLTGVNDVVQHVGAASYADDVRALAGALGTLAPVHVVELPMVNTSPPAGIAQRTKRFVQRWMNDGGRDDVVPAYRAALAAGPRAFSVVDYDAFSRGPAVDRGLYERDGIHLTLAGFGAYGAYLGRMMPLPPVSPSRP